MMMVNQFDGDQFPGRKSASRDDNDENEDSIYWPQWTDEMRPKDGQIN